MWFSTECWAWQIVSVPRPHSLWNEFRLGEWDRFSLAPVPSVRAQLQKHKNATSFISFFFTGGNPGMWMCSPNSQVISFSLEELYCSPRTGQGGLRALCLCGWRRSWCKKTFPKRVFWDYNEREEASWMFPRCEFLCEEFVWVSHFLQKLLSVSLINEDISPIQKEY